MAKIFKTDGTIVDVEPKNGTDFQLEELNEIVDGYIEIVSLPKNKILVVNEEGMLRDMPLNVNASLNFGIMLVGDVLYCRSREVR